MIRIRKEKEITLVDLMEDALTQIPLYTEEWTNVNVSEPGITILEQLAGVNILQQEAIDKMAESIQEELLALAGFKAMDLQCSRVLVKAEGLKEDLRLPPYQRLTAGKIEFETNERKAVSSANLIGVYSRHENEISCHTYIMRRDIPLGEELFKGAAADGDEVYFVFDQPFPKGQEFIAYINTGNESVRNAPAKEGKLQFAHIQWEYYTTKGFFPVSCTDHTFCFLVDGEMRFFIPKKKAEIYGGLPQKGYVIRGTFTRTNYDISPKISYLSFGLFEVWQRVSNAVCFDFFGQSYIKLKCRLLEEEYIQVFCREERGGPYRLYREIRETGEEIKRSKTAEEKEEQVRGRYVQKRKQGFGVYEFSFHEKEYGFGPARVREGVKILIYHENLMRQYELGCVDGYDNQIISLPEKNILPDTFSLIAVRMDKQGEAMYNFILPESNGLSYRLDSEKGEVCIKEAGEFIGAKLILGSLSTTRGAEGNIRDYSTFSLEGVDTPLFNPAVGTGGRDKESIAKVKQRFLIDLNTTSTAVRQEDYERIVLETPGLCIHKVKAIINHKKNHVDIAVMPYSDKEFPMLTALYQQVIYDYLEDARLLSTEINIIQPVYLPIDVRGTIYVKRHYENCREEIEEVIIQHIDYIRGNQEFGSLLKFTEVFQAIEILSCVEYIHDLSLVPGNMQYGIKSGMDIRPGENCLCYPGKLYLEINESARSAQSMER